MTLSLSGVLFILLLIALGFCAVKFCQRRRFQQTPKVDVNDMYGTYDTSDQQSDYSIVQDTNDYYDSSNEEGIAVARDNNSMYQS